MSQNQYEQIALRAYQYWEDRGRPLGTPEMDWYRAEQEVREIGLAKVARDVGSALGRVVATIRPNGRLLPQQRSAS